MLEPNFFKKKSLDKFFCGRVGRQGSPYLHKSMSNPKYDDDKDVLAIVWKAFSLFFIF